MLRRRYGTFVGGLDLPDEKQETLSRPVRAAFVPQRLHVPLAYGPGPQAAPRVSRGQYVSAGDMLAEGSPPDSVHVLAPMSGLVSAFTTADVAAGGRFVTVDAVEMTALQPAQPPQTPFGPIDWRRAPANMLSDRLAEGALTTCSHPVRPLAAWLAEARQANVALLVVSGMEDEPYVTSDHRTLAEHGEDVLFALALLARIIGASETAMVVDERRTGDYAHVMAPAEAHGVHLIALPYKYPTGAEPILLKILTGLEVPIGRTSFHIGAAVISPATALAVARWALRGRPTLTRILTLAGHQIIHPVNIPVPFGTPCAELSQITHAPLTHGGPMKGLNCTPRAVVTPATNAVLALAAPEPVSPCPCIRCGWCTDHCPARLNVSLLNDALELADLPTARRAGAMACVDCGVCSYVCPSRLPLTYRVAQLKRAIAGRRQLARSSAAEPAS